MGCAGEQTPSHFHICHLSHTGSFCVSVAVALKKEKEWLISNRAAVLASHLPQWQLMILPGYTKLALLIYQPSISKVQMVLYTGRTWVAG